MRNAFNNGFMVLQCPGLVEYLRETLAEQNASTIPGPEIEINYRESLIRCEGKEFEFTPLGRVPQELVVAGGAENLVRHSLASSG